MKERLINVLKIIFIIFGVLFFVILLFSFMAFLGITKLADMNFNIVGNTKNKLKDIQPIISYVENYKEKNNVYPKELGEIKIKKNLEYKYEINKDANCYTITLKPKKANITQQYQRCLVKTNNSNSTSESFIEFSN
ncbi:MAG: hypothetical protein IJ003_05315 [Candidatus Gastranaerophilales bacterium]|nr:hypothetical protein [Candidatus Gastranaerophilales bacterium]